MNDISILHAPSPLGLKPPAPGKVPGVRSLPEAFRACGFHDGLDADFLGTLEPPAYDFALDPQVGVRNCAGIGTYSLGVANALNRGLDAGGFLVVLGGDCSILLGCALGLRRRGRFGLAFIDGHTDTLTPATSATGGAAGMDLAIATGQGLRLLTDMEGRRPYVRETDAVVIGCRDLQDVEPGPEPRVQGTGILVHDLERIRNRGSEKVATDVLAQLEHPDLDGFWIHVDVDVLDFDSMPAVDSPQPGGLSHEELAALLGLLVASPAAVGLEVTIYDPDLDPSGEYGRAFVRTLLTALDCPPPTAAHESPRGPAGSGAMTDDVAPVRISPYQETWPRLFEREEVLLRRLLGPWLRGSIEHVGSTAVPGLAAKPIIDIMAGVTSLEESLPARAILADADYHYAPYRSDVMHWFCKPGPAKRTHHLHLVPHESELWKERVAFRDRLRERPDVAQEYAELKRRLARAHRFDRDAYTNGKTAFIAAVLHEISGTGR